MKTRTVVNPARPEIAITHEWPDETTDADLETAFAAWLAANPAWELQAPEGDDAA